MFKSKIFVSAVLFVLCSSTLKAQTPKWSLGIEAGPAMSSLYGNETLKSMQKSRLASIAGLSLQYQMNKRIALKTGLAHELKGNKFDLTIYDGVGQALGEQTLFYNFQYLTLPLLMQVNFNADKKIQYHVSAGPYVSYLLSITQNHPFFEPGLRNGYQDFDAGLITGLGISYPIKSRLRVSAEIRNQLGLTNVSRTPIPNNGTIKNNSAQLLLGMQWFIR